MEELKNPVKNEDAGQSVGKIKDALEKNSYVSVAYSAHVAEKGWLAQVRDGQTAGTTGESRRMEAVKIRLENAGEGDSILYSAHVAGKGWLPYVKDGETAGTTGESRQMEALKIKLSRNFCSVEYRVHMAELGWSKWCRNDEVAGTTGQGRRMEAVEIRLV